MNLLEIINRTPSPTPWSEGDNIPWHDPGFSRRMLREHLTQEHDAASRRFEKIDQHISWINEEVLSDQCTKILDLGCGPGLYSNRLARMGNKCIGIDYSPASIEYAREQAKKDNLDCTYLHQDIRKADYGAGFGLAMLIYGEFNVFSPADIRPILKKANAALVSDGLLLLEPHKFSVIKDMAGTLWYSAKDGLFSNVAYICLKESIWDEESKTTTTRYFVVDASTREVTRYAQSFQAYTDEEYRSALEECGFGNIKFFPSLTGVEDESQRSLFAVVAQKMSV